MGKSSRGQRHRRSQPTHRPQLSLGSASRSGSDCLGQPPLRMAAKGALVPKSLPLFCSRAALVWCYRPPLWQMLKRRCGKPGLLGPRLVTKDEVVGRSSFLGSWQELATSTDLRHVAMPARRGASQFVWYDGVVGALYSEVRALQFSPDGKRVGYLGYRDKKPLIVIDGRENGSYDCVAGQPFLFSPDGKRVAIIGCRDSKWIVTLDGQEGPQFDSLGGDAPRFSADSRHFA